MDEAWKENETIDNPPYPSPKVCPPRDTLLHVFELCDVYKPHRPSPVVRLELVSAQYAHCLIDAHEDTLLAFPMGDRVSIKQTNYIPIVGRLFYQWGLDCSMVEKSDFANFILPSAENMAVALIDSLDCHLDMARGKTTLQGLLSTLIVVKVNVTTRQSKIR
jgi:hypothetical protein